MTPRRVLLYIALYLAALAVLPDECVECAAPAVLRNMDTAKATGGVE